MLLVFDLDGCVIDNRKATRFSYEMAGVTEFPDDWFHKSGWATQEQLRVKAGLYPRALYAMGRLRAAGKLLMQCGGTVLSGCSPESLEATLDVFPVLAAPGITVLCAHTLDDKLDYLNMAGPEGGLYFDDWTWALKRVRRETKWKAIDASQL